VARGWHRTEKRAQPVDYQQAIGALLLGEVGAIAGAVGRSRAQRVQRSAVIAAICFKNELAVNRQP
jgi:hypothetical protein